MGSGNTLRWLEHDKLRKMMDVVIDGIEECRDNQTGWLLGFPEGEFMKNEQADYARSWFTQGLIEAGKAGNPKAFTMLRSIYNWFNNVSANPYLPYIFDGVSNGGQGQIASTRVGLETPIGTAMDMATARAAYRDEFWMQQMRMRNASGFVNFPMPAPNHPHCYQITALLAIFDSTGLSAT